MAGEITQKLGFDAAGAITSLTQLTSKLNAARAALSNFADTAGRFNAQAKGVSKTFKNLGGASSKAADTMKGKAAPAAKDLGKSMDQMGKQGAKATKDLTLSWSTMLRVIQTQIIVRAIYTVINAFKDAIASAHEFRTSIAEIRTIADETLGGMQGLTAGVKKLAAELGKPAADVAEGLYQTLSNQVVAAGEAYEFLAEAEKLAIITHSETKDAVNALSSVMNSYNMTADQAQRVSGSLFKTVELGRLRLEDIADILGRVTPLTKAMGVSWEETAAAIATMTRQGVKADTAITQMRAVMIKLIKPTTAMRDLYKEWGVTTAAQAIKKFGSLTALLADLAKRTGGNNEEMAKYSNRVRAITAVLGLHNKEGAVMAETLDNMQDSITSAKDAWDEWTKLDFHRINVELEKISIKWTEIGENALPVIAKFLELFNKLIPSATMLVSAIGALAVAATAGAVACVAAFTGIGVALSAVLVPVAIAAGAFAVLYSTIRGVDAFIDLVNNADDSARRIKFITERVEAEIKQMREERTQFDDKEWKKQEQAALEYASTLTKEWSKLTNVLKIETKIWQSTLGDIFKNVIKSGSDLAAKMSDILSDSGKGAEASLSRIKSITARMYADDLSSTLQNADARGKFYIMMQEADKQMAEARKLYAAAGLDDTKRQEAADKAKSAEDMARNALQHSQSMDNRGAEYQARNKIRSIQTEMIAEEIKGEKKRTDLNKAGAKKRVKDIEREAKLRKELLASIREQMGDLGSFLNMSTKDQAAWLTELKEKYDQLGDTLFDAADIEFGKMLGIDDAMLKFNTQLKQTMREATIDWEREVARLRELLSARAMDVEVNWKGLEKLSELSQAAGGEAISITSDAGETLRQTWADATEVLKEAKENSDKVEDAQIKLEGAVDKVSTTIENIPATHFVDLGKVVKEAGSNADLARAIFKTTFDTLWGGEKASDAAKEALKEMGDEGPKAAKRMSNSTVDFITSLQENLGALQRGGYSTKAEIALLEDQLLKLKGKIPADLHADFTFALDGIKEGAIAAKEKLDLLSDAPAEDKIKTAKNFVEGMTDAAAEGATKIKDQGTEMGEVGTKASELNPKLIKLYELLQKGADTTQNQAENIATSSTATANMALASGNVATSWQGISTTINEATTNTATMNDKINDSVASSGAAKNAVDGWKGSLDTCTKSGGQAAGAMAAAGRAAIAAGDACAVASAKCAGAGVKAQSGRSITYRAQGGGIRGTDNVPAMLSMGERVINARSARNFSAQLSAINANQRPLYRESGGAITNIGDIHVNVPQDSIKPVTAREIAVSLRRELQRKTSRL